MSDPFAHLSREERIRLAKKVARETLENEIHQAYLEYVHMCKNEPDEPIVSEAEFSYRLTARWLKEQKSE